MSISIAAPQKNRIKPAFMVKKLEGQVDREICEFDKTGKIIRKKVKVDAGWLVTTAKGHSIRVFTEAEMARLGFDQTIPLVDMDSDGDVVGAIPNMAVAQ